MRFDFLILYLAALATTPAFASDGPGKKGCMNAKHSLAVDTDSCGQSREHAPVDAVQASVAPLVGIELLENYRRPGGALRQGTGFLSDMGRSFSAKFDELSSHRLEVKDCILGGLLCRSQIGVLIVQASV